jgi:predicted secreted protein
MNKMKKKEYIEKVLKPILDDIILNLCLEKPDDPAQFMINYLQSRIGNVYGDVLSNNEKNELNFLKNEIKKYKDV